VSDHSGLGSAGQVEGAANVSPNDEEAAVRAEIEKVLVSDASVLGDVYRGLLAGLSDEALRVQRGVDKPNFVCPPKPLTAWCAAWRDGQGSSCLPGQRLAPGINLRGPGFARRQESEIAQHGHGCRVGFIPEPRPELLRPSVEPPPDRSGKARRDGENA
jgi:hypothetical protein